MQRAHDLDVLTDYARIAFQLDMISLTRLAAFLQQNHILIARLYALVGQVDALLAVASVRASLPSYALPEWSTAPLVEAEGLAHPLLSHPVTNDMRWTENSLITGSNASGKSTFVKALAINAILAQTIFTCWAKRFLMPRAQVMSSMALRDHLKGGDSYFIVEIKSLRRILSALRNDMVTLCFVDEILRGTNTVERIASSTSLLRYLETQNALCIAATHDIELTQLLQGYRQYHFREEMSPQGMAFPYRLMDGPSATRNAIRLLEQMHFPKEVTASADQMAEAFDATGKWA
jgi:DNA mismatch repair ATPase MutS